MTRTTIATTLAILAVLPTTALATDLPAADVQYETCTGTFTDSGGSIDNYSNSESFTTELCSETGTALTLDFTDFELESGFDSLTVYDGLLDAAGVPLPGTIAIGEFTGTSGPGVVTSTTTDACITAVFTSDSSVTRPGWQAEVSCAPITQQDGLFETCSGSYADSGGAAGTYTNSESSEITLCSNTTEPINLIFTELAIETNFDGLTLIDGLVDGTIPYTAESGDATGWASPPVPTAGGSIIGTFDNADAPPIISSTSADNCITAIFFSDTSVSFEGWLADITCGCVDVDVDGVCDVDDLCDGDDATGDTDLDGVCDDIDMCEGDDTSGNTDGDFYCDDLDICDGDDFSGDGDADGICDDIDFALLATAVVPREDMTFLATNAPEGQTVSFYATLRGFGAEPCTTLQCGDLFRPQLIGTATANASGAARLDVTVPNLISAGDVLYFQASFDDGTDADTSGVTVRRARAAAP